MVAGSSLFLNGSLFSAGEGGTFNDGVCGDGAEEIAGGNFLRTPVVVFSTFIVIKTQSVCVVCILIDIRLCISL